MISEEGRAYINERKIERKIPLRGEDIEEFVKIAKAAQTQRRRVPLPTTQNTAYMYGLKYFEEGFYFKRRSAADPTDLTFSGILRPKEMTVEFRKPTQNKPKAEYVIKPNRKGETPQLWTKEQILEKIAAIWRLQPENEK